MSRNKTSENVTAASVGSDSLLAPLYAAAGQIVCRKYYCCCCAGRRDAALEKAKFGPAAFLHAVINYNGMICGCAEWMIATAHDALGANVQSEPRPATRSRSNLNPRKIMDSKNTATNGVGSTGGSALARIHALQAKAAMKQAAVDSCQGHIWGQIYVSKIDHSKGSSAACIRCGERRAWTDIGPNEQWEHDTSLPNPKDEPRRL